MTLSYPYYAGLSGPLVAVDPKKADSKKEEPKKKKSATDSLMSFGAKAGKKAGKQALDTGKELAKQQANAQLQKQLPSLLAKAGIKVPPEATAQMNVDIVMKAIKDKDPKAALFPILEPIAKNEAKKKGLILTDQSTALLKKGDYVGALKAAVADNLGKQASALIGKGGDMVQSFIPTTDRAAFDIPNQMQTQSFELEGSNQPMNKKDSKGLSTGAKIGIGVGILATVGLGAAIFYKVRQNKEQEAENQALDDVRQNHALSVALENPATRKPKKRKATTKPKTKHKAVSKTKARKATKTKSR